MAEYEVRFVASAAKEFRALPSEIKHRVRTVIERLRHNPYSGGTCKLKGREQLYRIRIGAYRIIYELDKNAGLILVTRVRHRREAYR